MSVYLYFAIRYNIYVEVATKRLLLTLSLGSQTQQQAHQHKSAPLLYMGENVVLGNSSTDTE
jgi:hypothetical protein